MIIEKLIATNFKKHKSINLDFTPGRNLITGSNYTGKSTVLQAILVGLYGNAMAPGTAKDLVHDDAKDFCVELWLDNGVCITRTAKNSSVLDPQGEVQVRTHTAVNKWCEEMLETDRKTFLRVFASEQGSPQALLAMEGSELQRFLESAIGLDVLDKVTKKVRTHLTKTTAERDAHAELMLETEVVGEYIDQCGQYEIQIDAASSTAASCKAIIETAERELKQDKAEHIRQGEVAASLSRYRGDKKTLAAMMADIPKHVKQVPLDKIAKALAEEYDRLKDMDMGWHRLKRVAADTAEMQEELLKVDSLLLQQLPKEVSSEEAREHLSLCIAAVQRAGEDVSAVENSLNSRTCPTCDRPFEGVEGEEVLAEKLVALREAADAAVAKKNKAREVLVVDQKGEENYAKALKRHERAKDQQAALNGHVDKLGAEALKLRRVFTPGYADGSLKTGLDVQKRSLEEQQLANRDAKKDDQRRESVQLKLDALVEPETEELNLEELAMEIESNNALLIQTTNKRAEASNQLTDCTAKLNSLEKLLEANQSILERFDIRAKAAENYAAIVEGLNQARQTAVKDAFAQVMGIASEFAKACTGGDITEVYMGEAGIRYKEGGRARGTVSASGAQKTLIGLGMKLGLSQVIRSPFNALLLDEISADMDPDVSLACLTVLGEYCEQALIVSHTASDVADNVIELS